MHPHLCGMTTSDPSLILAASWFPKVQISARQRFAGKASVAELDPSVHHPFPITNSLVFSSLLRIFLNELARQHSISDLFTSCCRSFPPSLPTGTRRPSCWLDVLTPSLPLYLSLKTLRPLLRDRFVKPDFPSSELFGLCSFSPSSPD